MHLFSLLNKNIVKILYIPEIFCWFYSALDFLSWYHARIQAIDLPTSQSQSMEPPLVGTKHTFGPGMFYLSSYEMYFLVCTEQRFGSDFDVEI